MKRLLLSTTFIFVTLTGVQGANLTPASADSIQSRITAVDQRVEQLSAQIADLPAQIASAVNPLSADVATLKRDVAALKTALIPAAPTPSTTSLDTLFNIAFTAQNSDEQEQALIEISPQISTVYPSITKDALHSIEVSINSVIDNILSYEPVAFWTPQVCAMLTMCIAVDLYLVILFFSKVEKESDWRVGITVPMGGGSTLGVCLAAFTKFFTWWKESEKSDTLLKIQETWGNIFSNPHEKAFLVKLLSHYWISKKLDSSRECIQTALKKAFSLAKDMNELPNELRKLTPKY